jgi:hypothetical protein
MAVIQEVNIDGYGNHFTLNAEEIGTDVASNTSTVKVWLDLWVVSGGRVSSANSRVNVTGGQESNLGYINYSTGGYRLKEATYTAGHNSDGSGSTHVEGWFNGGIGWYGMSGDLGLTKFNRQSTINSFTGNDIKGDFKATYTASTGSYENRLRISIPNVQALDTYRNYVSGTAVRLSQASINYIRNYTNNKTIQLGGVIETWQGSTKIGESSEIKINCKVSREAHIRLNGVDKAAIPYVRINNEWKESTPYIRVNGSWKEES